MSQEKPKQPGEMVQRPDNLVKALFGIDYKGLTEDEQAMKRLLVEKYKESGKILLGEVRKWRNSRPEASLGDAIRALFEAEETAELEG